MRRPRSKLEVSTFPFLAVLLCAMGALLLLLFIMDRRAKIAAQHTASEAIAERKKRTQEEEDARQAEWEKARDALHQSLLDQHDQVVADAKGVLSDLDGVNKKLSNLQSGNQELTNKMQREAALIASLKSQIAGQRAGLKETEFKDGKAKAELIAAARELAEMERAFQHLKALKDREKQVYSVVPYRGKRGEIRAPIYVECVRSGVVFHPEKKMLDGWDFTPESLKAEVERRTGALAAEKSAKEKSRTIAEERKGPYVLFLIRPEGIGSYYKAQAGLKGYDLDFGYELVDEDWVLDFNGDPNGKSSPPIDVAKSGVPKKMAPTPFAMGGAAGTGDAAPTSGSPSGGGTGPSGNPRPGSGLAPVGAGARLDGGVGVGGGGGLPAYGGGAGQGQRQGAGAVGPLMPPMTPKVAGGFPSAIGNPSYCPAQPGVPNNGPAFVPIAKMPAPVAVASSGGIANPEGLPPAPNGGKASPGGGAAPGLAPPATPIPGQSVGATPGAGGGTGEANASGGGGTGEANTAGGARTGEANAGDGGVPVAPGKGTPTFGLTEPKKPASPRPPLKVLGNRDFVITIDCYANHATVFPSGLQYRWSGPNANANDDALVKTVTNLIARRQASVRIGEPAYRPVIRFQVSPDGLRTFLHIYPLLAPLNITMTRENVQD